MDPFGGLMQAMHYAVYHQEEMRIAQLAESLTATAGVGALASGIVVEGAVIAVFMSLGAGYLGAREDVRNDNSMAGFSQGFVMGLLGWSWQSAVNHFGRFFVVRISTTDSGNDVVRVNAYNRGLRGGYFYASAFPEEARKPLAQKLHKMARAQVGDWTENDKISYVIDLAGALKRLNGW